MELKQVEINERTLSSCWVDGGLTGEAERREVANCNWENEEKAIKDDFQRRVMDSVHTIVE